MSAALWLAVGLATGAVHFGLLWWSTLEFVLPPRRAQTEPAGWQTVPESGCTARLSLRAQRSNLVRVVAAKSRRRLLRFSRNDGEMAPAVSGTRYDGETAPTVGDTGQRPGNTRSPLPILLGLAAVRLAATAAILLLAASHGALALLCAGLGIVLARPIVLRITEAPA